MRKKYFIFVGCNEAIVEPKQDNPASVAQLKANDWKRIRKGKYHYGRDGDYLIERKDAPSSLMNKLRLDTGYQLGIKI